MYGTFIAIANDVIINYGVLALQFNNLTSKYNLKLTIPLQVIRWGVGWSRVSMVQDFCGLERSASSLQGNEGGVVGVGGGFGRSTVSKWSGERSSSPLGQ